MRHQEPDSWMNNLTKTSRRGFLGGAAAFAIATPGTAQEKQFRPARSGPPFLAYVGTYNTPQGPEGQPGRGEGIYLFEMNRLTGALTQREVTTNSSNPSWLDFDPARTHLYSVNEIDDYRGGKSGAVSAYAIDRKTGHLDLLNTVSSEGAGPAHLSVHPSGKYVLVANYAGGTVAVIAIGPNGELGGAADVHHDTGTVGPQRAASAPPGSFAISGHDFPHAHMIQADPSGKFVIVNDLGLDLLYVWKFDVGTGKLSDPVTVPLPPGDGPRHFAFHPSGKWGYSIQEEASTVVLWDYDDGKLAAKQTLSSLPHGFKGTNFPSEIRTSTDGKFVYAANRLHDTVSWFSVGRGGKLAPQGEEWTRGDYPRSFNFDPTGNFLYSCNQNADAVTAFRVNRATGGLAFTGQYTAVGTPACIIFLT